MRLVFTHIPILAYYQSNVFPQLNYYLDGLLEDVIGLSAVTARLVAAINSTQFFIFATLGLLFIDRHGRRKMLMGGAAAQAFAYTGAGISIALISRAPYPVCRKPRFRLTATA